MTRLLAILLPATAFGQCSMCFRTSAALNAYQQQALNLGIFVLMIPPLVILAALVYLAVKHSPVGAEDLVSPAHNERNAP